MRDFLRGCAGVCLFVCGFVSGLLRGIAENVAAIGRGLYLRLTMPLYRVGVVSMRPSDVLVVQMRHAVTPDQAQRVAEIARRVFPGARVMVLDREAKLDIIRQAERDGFLNTEPPSPPAPPSPPRPGCLGVLLLAALLVGCAPPRIDHGTVVELRHVEAYTTPESTTSVYVPNADGSGSFSTFTSPETFHPARWYVVVESFGYGGKPIRNEIPCGSDFSGCKVGDAWRRDGKRLPRFARGRDE